MNASVDFEEQEALLLWRFGCFCAGGVGLSRWADGGGRELPVEFARLRVLLPARLDDS